MRTLRLVAAPAALLLVAGLAACGAEQVVCKATAAPPAPAVAAAGAPLAVRTDATLPRMPLKDVEQRELPAGGPVDDHGIVLGGIGSDIFPAQAPDEYWMVTDRGPNGKIDAGRTFPVPSFDPSIVRVKLTGTTVAVQQLIPITDTAGKGVTGLSNSADRDEKAFDPSGKEPAPLNPAGLDTEGLVRAPNGDFWVSEEYGPSIVHISPTGTVLARYVPQGLKLGEVGYPVFDTLPTILAKRKSNRGFESLAITPDGGTLYAMLQSPLSVPDEAAGDKSREVRLVAVNPQTGRATAEYVYPLDEVTAFDPGAKGDPSEMKISGLAWYGPDQLVVDERTDDVAKLYLAKLDPAKNILGGPFDDPATSPALEQTDLAAAKPLAKALLLDLTADVTNLPKKIEGVAVRDRQTLVVSNDNDFGVPEGKKAFSSQGQVCDSGVPSQVLVLNLQDKR